MRYTEQANRSAPGRVEFILLMAAMMALNAFSIDSIMPALDQISQELDVLVDNHRQFIITSILLGYSTGVLIYGFAADRFGRRKPVIIGFALYSLGALVCLSATSLEILLTGRVLQGIGAAGPAVISMAIVRDLYKGRDMAQLMSLIMMVFIGVPMIAPVIGQGVMLLSGWRIVFVLSLVYAIVCLGWFWRRQQETLNPEYQQLIAVPIILGTVREVLTQPRTRRYLLAMGSVFGAFIAYLSTSQQVFQEIYSLGTRFPLVFAALGAMFGIGSYLNSRLVQAIGSQRLVHRALSVMVLVSLVYLAFFHRASEVPPLWLHLTYLAIVMFCFAFVPGNMTSMAMEPLGHIAGSASSIYNSVSTAIAIALATLLGSQLQGNVFPVVIGFGILCAVAWILNYQKH